MLRIPHERYEHRLAQMAKLISYKEKGDCPDAAIAIAVSASGWFIQVLVA